MATSATPGRSSPQTKPPIPRDLSSRLEAPRARHGNALKVVIEVLERLFDAVAVFTGTVLAYNVYRLVGLGRRVEYPVGWLTTAAIAFSVVFILLLEHLGEYRSGSLLGVRETERVLRAAWYSVFLVFPIAFFSGRSYSRLVVLFVAAVVPICVLIVRQFSFRVIERLCIAGDLLRPAAIYGSGRSARKVYSALLRSPKLGLKPVAFLDEKETDRSKHVFEASYHRKNSAQVIAMPITIELLKDLQISSLVLCELPPASKLSVVEECCRQAGVEVYLSPGLMHSEDQSIEFVDIDGMLFARTAGVNHVSLYDLFKRVFDVLAAGVITLVISPILLAIALAVKFSSRGKILFVQERVGRGGTQFAMYKFRSMHADAPKYAFSPREVEDPRITLIGRFLRRTSLDELPQLFNVIRGEMSLVGPRPEMPFIVERYTPQQRRRLDVKPGITGLWQLSADRAYLIHENIEYDLYYVRNRNFFLDLAVLVHTAVFAARGV
ncbi:Undecaprenyl-phosphate galactosephosphotransferase [Candidatus Koribacter versatilis Ellin345]|uniref:Undecaprenyl-phosphate galactosephosphotransferase n=1 Tax=Koribacter versatilis (strain Ellin345) TaxID=204669 RepID=Q1IJZ3_KORVE|nr:sugar transferase [Candidatus Koribacter versatilis]ABF42807.1 Undecaprenyl-phosphate galactosephosphotransferase [Candidatus Koribacter versatilis Ellin345]